MLDVLILAAVALLVYGFLRSRGGEGLTIKAKIAPISTPQGKKDRIVAVIVLIVVFGAMVFVAMRQTDTNPLAYLAVPLLVGLVFVGASIFKPN